MITIVITIMPHATPLPRPLEFDAPRFSEWLRAARLAEGWSTRDLARRANISQAYVVALEAAASSPTGRAPVPTVNVMAALAASFGVDPLDLLRLALRPAPRHVLLVVDGAAETPVDLVRRVTRGSSTDSTHDIRLHRRSMREYRPDAVAHLLDVELGRIADDVEGRRIGLVFGEVSTVMSYVSNPEALVEFESRWKHLVVDAARNVGAHAVWNVCVYRADALRHQHATTPTLDFLVHHHDEYWYARGDRVVEGDGALHRIRQAIAA